MPSVIIPVVFSPEPVTRPAATIVLVVLILAASTLPVAVIAPSTVVPVAAIVNLVVPATPTVVAALFATVTFDVPLLIPVASIPVKKLPLPKKFTAAMFALDIMLPVATTLPPVSKLPPDILPVAVVIFALVIGRRTSKFVPLV